MAGNSKIPEVGTKVSWQERITTEVVPTNVDIKFTGVVTEDSGDRCSKFETAVKTDIYSDADKKDPTKYQCVLTSSLRWK